MKRSLLIITQTVDENDSNLGFFCAWIREFAKQAGKVYVLANKVGEHNLPDNVMVMSLGKERGVKRVGRLLKFWYYLFKYLSKVDAVFAHMCPEYVVYGGWAARLYGKKIGLWYLHKSLTFNLKLASRLVNYIFTAHAAGCPVKNSKVIVTGHGIDLNLFKNIKRKESNEEFVLLTVGRISESKNLFILVKSAILLQQKINKKVKFLIVGEAYLDRDKKYLEELKNYIKEKEVENMVEFIGKVPHKNIADYYQQADIFLNAGKTGGVDKAVLEAMAAGMPVITSNFSFQNILSEDCLFDDGNVESLLVKIQNYKEINTERLRIAVLKNHNLKNTIGTIINKLIKI